MKKVLIFVGTVVVIIGISIGYWLASPLWRVDRVSEELPEVEAMATTTEVQTLASGSFTGFDALHTGSGTARLISVNGKKFVRFEEDFTVQNGPDLFVGLGKDGEYTSGSELGRLKGNTGSQNYDVPEGVEVEEVWIWCRAFSVPFAKVVLQ